MRCAGGGAPAGAAAEGGGGADADGPGAGDGGEGGRVRGRARQSDDVRGGHRRQHDALPPAGGLGDRRGQAAPGRVGQRRGEAAGEGGLVLDDRGDDDGVGGRGDPVGHRRVGRQEEVAAPGRGVGEAAAAEGRVEGRRAARAPPGGGGRRAGGALRLLGLGHAGGGGRGALQGVGLPPLQQVPVPLQQREVPVDVQQRLHGPVDDLLRVVVQQEPLLDHCALQEVQDVLDVALEGPAARLDPRDVPQGPPQVPHEDGLPWDVLVLQMNDRHAHARAAVPSDRT